MSIRNAYTGTLELTNALATLGLRETLERFVGNYVTQESVNPLEDNELHGPQGDATVKEPQAEARKLNQFASSTRTRGGTADRAQSLPPPRPEGC